MRLTFSIVSPIKTVVKKENHFCWTLFFRLANQHIWRKYVDRIDMSYKENGCTIFENSIMVHLH